MSSFRGRCPFQQNADWTYCPSTYTPLEFTMDEDSALFLEVKCDAGPCAYAFQLELMGTLVKLHEKFSSGVEEMQAVRKAIEAQNVQNAQIMEDVSSIKEFGIQVMINR